MSLSTRAYSMLNPNPGTSVPSIVRTAKGNLRESLVYTETGWNSSSSIKASPVQP